MVILVFERIIGFYSGLKSGHYYLRAIDLKVIVTCLKAAIKTITALKNTYYYVYYTEIIFFNINPKILILSAHIYTIL